MITYNLNIDGQNYEDYYSTLKRLKKMIIDKDCNKSKKYIDDFKIYIKNFEELKDDKYYFIEIILIGVLFYEYIDYTLNFKPYLSFVYNFLNKNRNSKFKSQIDIIRGKVNTSLYTIKISKSNSKATSYNIDDFCKLIKWLDATYDFKDEVIRLKIWYKFLKTKSPNYISFFFDFALNHVKYMKKLGKKYNFKVYIIEHETTLSSLDINKNIGIIGIACIPNLISGGFKALRLGFIPQCVVLDYCGCSNHWLYKKHMTKINENRLLDIILNNSIQKQSGTYIVPDCFCYF